MSGEVASYVSSIKSSVEKTSSQTHRLLAPDRFCKKDENLFCFFPWQCFAVAFSLKALLHLKVFKMVAQGSQTSRDQSGFTDPTQATARRLKTQNYTLKEKSKYCSYPKKHSTVEKGRWKTKGGGILFRVESQAKSMNTSESKKFSWIEAIRFSEYSKN